jgi:hypothetical protein
MWMAKWKAVPWLAITYEISDGGQLRRVTRRRAQSNGKLKFVRTLVDSHTTGHGYLKIEMYREKDRLRAYVHRLVWETFRGTIPSGLDVNHRDGNKSNNRLENLEVVTRSENMLHMFKHLKPSLNRKRGTAHHFARLKPDDVKTILELRRAGKSGYAIAKIYDVSPTAIYLIFNGTNWKHVTGF